MKEFVSDSLQTLNIIGANPLSKNKMTIVTTLALLTAGVPVFLDLVFNWKGPSSFETCSDLTAIVQVMFKFFTVLYNRSKFVKLLHCIEDFWPLDKLDKTTQEELEAKYRVMRKFLKCLKAMCWIMIFTYICKPFIIGTKTLELEWYLFSLDLYSSPTFEIIYVALAICALLGVLLIMGFDILFMSLVFHLLCQLKLIRKAFASIYINPTTIKHDQKLQDEFNIVAKHHSKILKFVKDLNEVYSAFFLVQFLTSTLCMCGSLLLLSMNGILSSPGKFIKSLIYLTTFMGQMFLFCLAGSSIKSESEKVAESVYDMQWWVKTQPQLRKAITLVTLRSHRTPELNGSGFFAMDIECFTVIVKNGFSFYTLVQAVMNNREQ